MDAHPPMDWPGADRHRLAAELAATWATDAPTVLPAVAGIRPDGRWGGTAAARHIIIDA